MSAFSSTSSPRRPSAGSAVSPARHTRAISVTLPTFVLQSANRHVAMPAQEAWIMADTLTPDRSLTVAEWMVIDKLWRYDSTPLCKESVPHRAQRMRDGS